MALKFAAIIFVLFNCLGLLAISSKENRTHLSNKHDRHQALSAAKSLLFSALALLVASLALAFQETQRAAHGQATLLLVVGLVAFATSNMYFSVRRSLQYLGGFESKSHQKDNKNPVFHSICIVIILLIVLFI